MPGPKAAELELWGLTLEEATPTAEVWPDNVEAVGVFVRCMGQWRVGFGGPYALDYNVFPVVAPREFTSAEWPEIFEAVRVMEESALQTIAAQRKK